MEISLMELLDARERRVLIQNKIIKEYPCPLICFTMNIAGPVKTSPLILRAFNYGLSELEKNFSEYKILNRLIEYEKSGPAAFYSVSGQALDIKNICVSIEESTPLGRLFDMDVLDASGNKLERKCERSCIVCGKKGRSCAAGRLHSVEILKDTTKQIITRHFAESDLEYISSLAKSSLIKEVLTTPKPGLVDCNNTGSHRDMTVDSFIKSADALSPYFKKCVKIGIESSCQSPNSTFDLLRTAGLEAEKDMYAATGGVNTHKGIIYSMGVICGAIGRLWKPEKPVAPVDNILNECKEIVRLSTELDFANIIPITPGARAYLHNGSRGIRGEVAEGFPSVCNIALPVYQKALKSDIPPITEELSENGYSNIHTDFSAEILTKKENDAGVFTLLHLISKIYDTSIYNRGGEQGVLYAKKIALDLLEHQPISKSGIEKTDENFINMNLSPGGAADLLAITYFLSDLDKYSSATDSEIHRDTIL